MVYCAGKLTENLKLFYKSIRPNLWHGAVLFTVPVDLWAFYRITFTTIRLEVSQLWSCTLRAEALRWGAVRGGPAHSSRLSKIVNHESRQLIFEFHGSREITWLTRASFTNKPPHWVFLLYKAHGSLLMFHSEVIVWVVSISQVQVLRARNWNFVTFQLFWWEPRWPNG